MNKKLILIATMALALAACSDKDDTAKMGEPSDTMEGKSMLDETMDATKEMAADTTEAVKDTTGDVVEGAGDMAADAEEAVVDETGEMVDAAKEMVHDKAQGIADATADEMEAPAAGAASDAMQDAGTSMGQ